MKSYTKRGKNYKNLKFPITSKVTGRQYIVEIYPYGMNDDRYLEGCFVTLYLKRFLLKKEVKHYFCNNDKGQITISPICNPKIKTDYEYSLIGMTKCIVDRYEESIVAAIKTSSQLENDYKEFENWNGEV
jgi:hypothetical protein